MQRWLWIIVALALAGLCCYGGRAGAALVLRVLEPGTLLVSCVPETAGGARPSFRSLLFAGSKIMAQVDPTAPGLFCTVLPVLASGTALPVPGPPQAAPAPVSARAEPPGADAPDPGLVALYNTHTGETYALTDGVERVQGRGGVVRVAAVLEEELRRRGIRVLRTDKIHDGCYATSYLESEKTVRELVYTHPDLAALFDIHRDVKQPRAEATVKVEGRDVARVLIVVGSDARLPFPAWRQNFSFARRIADRAEALYPGLCLGVRVKEGRYNQFLHPRALLLEVGGVNNTLEEAEAAAKLFAVVLADVLLDNGTEAAAREAEE
ncbi:MAG: stage II sporulation protein P [Bacillota bacterium]